MVYLSNFSYLTNERTRTLLAVLISLIAPIGLFFINSTWFYTPVGYLDSYINVGIGLNYFDPTLWNDYYKISRMPWNLMEVIFRNLLSINAGQIMLSGFVFVLNGLFCFLAGKRLFNELVGLILAVFANAFPLLIDSIWNGGSDYKNVFSSPLYFAFVACVAAYQPGRERIPAFLAGIAITNAILTNSTYFEMCPAALVLVAAVIIHRKGNWRSFLISIAAGLAGALVTVIIIGLINASVGRGFWFFMPEVRFIKMMLSNPQKDVWWQPITAQNLANYPHLGFLFSVFVIAVTELALISLKRRWRNDIILVACHFGFILELAILLYWQILGHHESLIPAFFVSPLFTIALLSVSAAIYRCFAYRQSLITLSIFAILAPILFIVTTSHFEEISNFLHQFTTNATIIAGLGFLALYAFVMVIPKRAFILEVTGVAILLPLASATMATHFASFAKTRCHFAQKSNSFLLRADDYARTLVNHGKQVLVWAPPGRSLPLPAACQKQLVSQAPEVSYFAFSFAWMAHTYLTNPSPKMPEANAIPIDDLKSSAKDPRTLVAIFATDRRDVEAFRQRTSEASLTLEDAGTLYAPVDSGIPFVVFFRIRKP